MNQSALFSPLTLRGRQFANRIVVSPMSLYEATAEGMPTGFHDMHYANLALAGPGLVVLEATYVTAESRSTPGDLGLWNEAQAEALAALLARCRPLSHALFGLQLSHGGRKASGPVAWRPETVPDWPLLAASSYTFEGMRTPRAMTGDEILNVIDDHAAAAARAAAAGFDYLELHAGHGYLLHGFLSPISNLRTDDWGGDLEGRMRLVLETLAAIRRVWPQDRPLGVRISATDWADGGWNIDQSIVLARRLKAVGCDIVTASSGGSSEQQAIPRQPGYQAGLAAAIRAEADVATLAVGMIREPELADYIISSGQADLVGLGRAMIFDPRWPWKAAMRLGGPVMFPPSYERAIREFQPR